ncbi:MAG: hypothetical protein ACK4ZW_10040 [Blastomonas sp.]
MMRFALLALSPTLALAAPAMAADAPATRLVGCGSQSCLLVTGKRDDGLDPVRINGHQVDVTGTRKWRVRVPVATVRAWSAPHAQSISVEVGPVAHEPRLPVGMLGPKRDLAMLVVRVK